MARLGISCIAHTRVLVSQSRKKKSNVTVSEYSVLKQHCKWFTVTCDLLFIIRQHSRSTKCDLVPTRSSYLSRVVLYICIERTELQINNHVGVSLYTIPVVFHPLVMFSQHLNTKRSISHVQLHHRYWETSQLIIPPGTRTMLTFLLWE